MLLGCVVKEVAGFSSASLCAGWGWSSPALRRGGGCRSFWLPHRSSVLMTQSSANSGAACVEKLGSCLDAVHSWPINSVWDMRESINEEDEYQSSQDPMEESGYQDSRSRYSRDRRGGNTWNYNNNNNNNNNNNGNSYGQQNQSPDGSP
eukprot:271806-Rhodomonas_salina.1